ncbi:MAG: cache domain-containing protein, partial [Desulfovibrionales bacterium]
MSPRSRRKGLAFKLVLLILTTTSLIFAAAFASNYLSSKKLVLKKVESNARNLTRAKVNRIETVLRTVEQLPRFMARSLENQQIDQAALLASLSDMLVSSPDIFGTLAAFEPYSFDPGRYYFAPYFYRNGNEINSAFLGDEEYRYTQLDWYLIPKLMQEPVWSEPYYDEGGGNIIMSTYSVPFRKGPGEGDGFWGVVTSDISLDWLVDIVSSVSAFQTGYAFLISGNGVFVSHPDKSLIMRESIFSLAEGLQDRELRRIGREMIHGDEGFVPVSGLTQGKKSWLYYAPLPSSGWSLGVLFPEEELFADIETMNREMLFIVAFGLLFLTAAIILIA